MSTNPRKPGNEPDPDSSNPNDELPSHRMTSNTLRKMASRSAVISPRRYYSRQSDNAVMSNVRQWQLADIKICRLIDWIRAEAPCSSWLQLRNKRTS
jgi:hypothetical protein